MCTAQLMIILDATIVNVALPEAQRSLGFGAADRQWGMTAYALAFGSLLLMGGRTVSGSAPSRPGLTFLPQAVGAVVASLASGLLLRRLPGTVLIPAGMIMTAGWPSPSRPHRGSRRLRRGRPAGVTLVGAGLGLAVSVAINLGIYGVRTEDAGVASATVNAVQQVGSIGPPCSTRSTDPCWPATSPATAEIS